MYNVFAFLINIWMDGRLDRWLLSSIRNHIIPLTMSSIPHHVPPPSYPLVNVYITMDNHHLLWVNQLFQWPWLRKLQQFTRPGISWHQVPSQLLHVPLESRSRNCRASKSAEPRPRSSAPSQELFEWLEYPLVNGIINQLGW